MADHGFSLSPEQVEQWEAYRQWLNETPQRLQGFPTTMAPEIPSVAALIAHFMQAPSLMIQRWWDAHPERHPAESRPDA